MALGLSSDQARATVRLSLAPGVDPAAVQAAADQLCAVVDGLPAAG